ncbi:MAG: hypothetical protein GXO15_06855, partial [Crenarchaeota archaeon]|nr:hypothetical protein [Thermoproteota archaeon]
CILVVIDPFTGAYQEFCYTTKLLITPEDIASTLRNQCPDCVAHMDGRIYVKLPLLVASNSHYPSGTVGVSFSMSIQDGTVGVYPVFTISDKGLIDKLLKGIIPGASLWRGEGASWKGEGRLDYAYSDNIAPGETVWFWVWARPYYIVYDVEECGIAGCNYVGEEHEMVLADIAVYGSLIRGGVERRHLPSGISDALFRGTVLRNVRVPNGFLDDGVLAPGEYELISRIIDSFDTCGIDLDMTIPVGAMAGLATCTVLGLQSQGLACLAILTFTGSFQAIVSVESSSLGVGGVIVNHGDHPHVVNDFDIVEYIYIAVSRYEYVKPRLFFGACRYSVPAGVYLEFR